MSSSFRSFLGVARRRIACGCRPLVFERPEFLVDPLACLDAPGDSIVSAFPSTLALGEICRVATD